jgi:hypothetical protein
MVDRDCSLACGPGGQLTPVKENQEPSDQSGRECKKSRAECGACPLTNTCLRYEESVWP